MTKAAIYARPSAPGETLDAQMSRLRTVAEQREFSVVADYFDMALGMDRRRTFVVLIFFDPIDLYGCGIEAQAIVVYGHSAYLFKDLLEPFEAVVALRQEVRVAGGPMYLFCPKLKE